MVDRERPRSAPIYGRESERITAKARSSQPQLSPIPRLGAWPNNGQRIGAKRRYGRAGELKAKIKAAIAPEVVVKRINRRLAEDAVALRKARGSVAEQLGDYFIVADDSVIKCNLSLEKVAKEKGALEAWETVLC